jgi:hypothetical protein
MFPGGTEGMSLEPGSEKLPPTPPTHELQPQVYVAPVPQSFQNADEEQLLDETALETGIEETSAEMEPVFEEASLEYPTTDAASYEEGTEGYFAPASAEQETISDESAE